MIENYWRLMFGPRSEEFIEGVIAGVTAFAVWRDGREVVGIMQKPLKEEIAEIREGLGGEEKSEPMDQGPRDHEGRGKIHEGGSRLQTRRGGGGR